MVSGPIFNPREVVSIPVDGDTEIAISSNWAFDHVADLDAHTLNIHEQALVGSLYTGVGWRGGGSFALVADRMYAYLIHVARTMTFNKIYIQVTTGDVGKFAKLGIYNAAADLTPGTLVTESGIVDVGVAAMVAVTDENQLAKGYYYCVVVSDGTPTLRTHSPAIVPLGWPNTNLFVANHGYFGAHVYANAFPANFPAPTISFEIPVVALEVASLD